MKRFCTILVCALAAACLAADTPSDLENTLFESRAPAKPTALDKLVLTQTTGINPHPKLCSDAVFVRRVYLDVIGTLPASEEVLGFLNDTGKDKRRVLIDRLLERDEYADYWAMKWGDILRIKAEFPVNLWPNAAQAYHRWVRASLAENKPYDKFARELLTSSGSNFRVGPVNFYRAIQNRTPQGIAGAVALTFMGTRVDSWPAERLDGFAAFFSQIGYKPTREWKEEAVFWDPWNTSALATNGMDAAALETNKPPSEATFPDGRTVQLPADRDPREIFADWLIRPDNPWFTRAIVNRTWSWLMGRGIIHEPDDIREDNPPVNPELLAYLEKQMVSGRYDMKRFLRLVLNSSTYQASAFPEGDVQESEKHFASYPLRRLDAEVLIDAINKITGSSDLYTSAIPEPFTYIPANQPAISIADGSITSPFLTLFGRSARATGMENERVNRVLPSQWLHLLNSSHIQKKIEQGPRLKALLESGKPTPEIARELYLTILSRPPTAAEVKSIESYGKATRPGRPKPREEWIDIAWALINSNEFLYRH